MVPLPKIAKSTEEELKSEIKELNVQAEEFRRQVYQLQLEKDVLETLMRNGLQI